MNVIALFDGKVATVIAIEDWSHKGDYDQMESPHKKPKSKVKENSESNGKPQQLTSEDNKPQIEQDEEKS
jgi:hypothetical protein